MSPSLVDSKRIRLLVALALALLFALVLVAQPAHAGPRDADRDGMPNRWERNHGLNPYRTNGRGNPDRDRLTNLREYRSHSHPRREDTDRDGVDDGDEVKVFHSDPDDRDSDDDGRRDGHEDADGDGVKNEDEDDALERCRADDDDSDHDGVANEDENELGTKVRDADSDDDGVEDGDEDRDGDDLENEDEDDSPGDLCDGDRDHDGLDEEDENDAVGTVESFDATTGVLTVRFTSGSVASGTVTAETELEWNDCDCDDAGDPTADALVPGAGVEEVEIDAETGGVAEVELVCDEDAVEDEDETEVEDED